MVAVDGDQQVYFLSCNELFNASGDILIIEEVIAMLDLLEDVVQVECNRRFLDIYRFWISLYMEKCNF